MIIGLCGWIGSGKGTVADTLVNEYGFQKFSFADSLKDATAAIFGWSRDLLEGDTSESREFREKIDPWWTMRLGYDVTPRLILQRMGTEVMRNNLHQNIWIYSISKRIENVPNVVIPDVRFDNEIDFVRSVGGNMVWVKRGPLPTQDELDKMHVSETIWYNRKFDIDHIIVNDGTLDDLKERTSALLTNLSSGATIFHHSV